MLIVAALLAAGVFALTHFGAPAPGELTPAPSPTASPSIASGPDAVAQSLALKGLDAQRVFFVDNVRFAAGVGAELEELHRADPSLEWGTDLMVVVPAAEGEESHVTVIRAVSLTQRVFCVAEVATVQDAGTWFASTVNAPCPRVAPRMPGWSTNQTIGWL